MLSFRESGICYLLYTQVSIIHGSHKTTRQTYRLCQFNIDPRHSDECPVEIFDSLSGLLWCFVTHIADPPVWKTLGIGHMTFGAEMFS